MYPTYIPPPQISPEEQMLRRWLAEAKSEAQSLTIRNPDTNIAIDPGLFGARITLQISRRQIRSWISWPRDAKSAPSPFRDGLRNLADAMGLKMA